MERTITSTSKIVAGTLGIVCVSIVVGMGVYLPFYSNAARKGEEARRQLHQREPGQERAPGGVWKNLNVAAKQARENEDVVGKPKSSNINDNNSPPSS